MRAVKYATVRKGDSLHGALVDGDRVSIVNTASAIEAWTHRDNLHTMEEYSLGSVHFARVSPTPAHIICIGLNYRSHIAQLGRPVPQYPTLFAKYPTTLTGPIDDIVMPAISRRINGEVELAVVIGRTVHREPVQKARTAIAGYTVANDMSMRDWQHRTSETF